MHTSSETSVQANGAGLRVGTFGDRADPAILLVHGAGSTMLGWDDALCARLAAASRYVIRYDSRTVTGGAAGSLRELVADAAALIDALDAAPAHIVGISLGAGIGQLLALEDPERVASLTLASATPGGPGHSQPDLPGMSEELAAHFREGQPTPDWSDRAAVVEYLVDGERPFAPRSRPFDEAAARAVAERVVDRGDDLEASLSGAFAFDVGEPWRERLGEISAPTLVVHGDEDPLFPLPHGQALAREIPGAELLVMERTGHETFPPHTWDVVVPALLRLTTRAAAR